MKIEVFGFNDEYFWLMALITNEDSKDNEMAEDSLQNFINIQPNFTCEAFMFSFNKEKVFNFNT